MSTEQHDLKPHSEIWESFQTFWIRSTLVIVMAFALMWAFLV